METLPITLTIAGAAALLNLWLAYRTGRLRIASKIAFGDGGDPALLARIRAQANFVEYTPFFLILLGLIELARGPMTWLWVIGILYILARLLHAFGMDRPAPNPLRLVGTVATVFLLLGLAGYALTLPYLDRGVEAPVSYASGGVKLS